jgi:hypothetical protein
LAARSQSGTRPVTSLPSSALRAAMSPGCSDRWTRPRISQSWGKHPPPCRCRRRPAIAGDTGYRPRNRWGRRQSHGKPPVAEAKQSAGRSGPRIRCQGTSPPWPFPARMLSVIVNAPWAAVPKTRKNPAQRPPLIRGRRFMRWRGRTVSALRPAPGVVDGVPLDLTVAGKVLPTVLCSLLSNTRPT